MKVVGGPCGKRIWTPNSAIKRGWSTTQPLWRFESATDLPLTIECEGELYARREEAGITYYVHDPQPHVRASILRAIGSQRFWTRRFVLSPPGQDHV